MFPWQIYLALVLLTSLILLVAGLSRLVARALSQRLAQTLKQKEEDTND